MAKYEISHPRLPQLNGYSLEGPDDKQPTEEDLWFVAKQVVRPYGISQLTDEEKVSAWKNGFFEENQNMQGRESKVLEGLGELVKDAGVRFLQNVKLVTGGNISPALGLDPLKAFSFGSVSVTGGPVEKIVNLPDTALDYKKTENAEQFKEAGKLLYGLLDNTEDLSDLGDMVAESLKQVGMPFYANNKGARGRVKAAALDYAEKATVSGLAEGAVRGASTSLFLGKGANYLANALEVGAKDMLGMLDDSDILDLVNSEIGYDKTIQQYEDAADMGAMILENPGIAAKSVAASVGEALSLGTIDDKDIGEAMGLDVNDITQESELLQDLRSGFVEPDQGISFMTEILADPLNTGTGTVAKGLTFPQRVALSGKIKTTLSEVAVLNKKLAPLLKGLEKMPAEALVRNRVAQAAKPLMDELAQKQAILDKFGRNSLTARFAAQASPAELLKQASKIADNTAAGKMTMDMVYSAMKPAGKMSLARKSVMQAMKLNPEIAGASIGFALGGGIPGMVAGAMLPSMLKGARFLSVLPQEVALRFIMRSAADAGQEITEAQALQQWRQTTNMALLGTGILGLGSSVLGDSNSGSSLLGGALAVKMLPKLAKFADGFVRDARVVGSEMIFAQTTKDAGPFFNRLSMLPGAEEGLIGANKDRLQMLNAPSGNFFTKPIEPFITGAKTAKKRVGNMSAEFRAGGVGKQPVISETTRNLARFLDNNPMLGRSIEAVGRAGENLAVASALPAALGFVGAKGDVEGAVAGAAISLPFTMAGVGVGQYQKFKNKGELFEQAIGDLHYYREHLTKDEQVAFDKLPMGHRMGIAKYSISHPDVVIRPGKAGAGNWHFDEAIGQSIIEYNPLTGEGLFDGLLAHEIGHHIEVHGLTPMINKIYFGDPITGEGGVYGKYDADGNIVTNEEFNAIRDYYNRALIGDETISDSDRSLNQQNINRTTSEIFAEQVKDYLLSGKKEKGRTAVEKIIRSASDAMMGASFVRDFLMKVGRPLDGNGKFVEDGFFQGMKSIGKGVKIKRIPEITKLIDKYYADTRGLRKREIQGDPKKGPGEVPIDPSIRKEGKRPIDQDFDTAFTTEDQNNPAIQAVLNTGGLFKWRTNENGEAEVQKGPTGAPLRYTAGELKKEQRKQADHAVKVFQDAGIEILYDKKGNPYTNEISNLSPETIDKLAQGPWHPRQIQTLREISKSLREGDGERAGFLIGYFAASMGRKPKPVPFKYRHEMPYAFRMTKDGNLLVMLHDVDQLQRNLQFLQNWKKLPSEYQGLFDNDNDVWTAFNIYRNNTTKGLKGELDLDPNENRAILKKNFLNALHGAITQQQVSLNPLLSEIGFNVASRNTRRGFGAATRSFRIDRVFDVKRSGVQSSSANIDRLKQLYMPRQQKGFDKKVLLRTRQETMAKIDELAQLRGLSRNDVLNMILDGKASLETKVPDQDKIPPLTAEEQRLLSLRNVSEQDAPAYREAVLKRQRIAEQEIIGDRKFMPQMELDFSAKTEPSKPNFWRIFKIDPKGKNVYREVADVLIDTGDSFNDDATAFYQAPLLGLDTKILRQEMRKAQRRHKAKNSYRKYMPREQQKARKYGYKLKQAFKTEGEQIKQSRKLWKEKNFESPYFQHFMRGEENEAPVFATLKNQNYKPIPLYYFGELGSPVGAYDKMLDASSMLLDKVSKKDSHRWSETSPITVTTNRLVANKKQKADNPNLKPLVLASNAKYIFDPNNPSHRESITLPGGERLPVDSESLFAYEPEIKKRGWHGYKSMDSAGNEMVTIFDSKRLKLIEDQTGETKFFSKDRPFGKVSGLFGYPTATSRFRDSANIDVRYMPNSKELDAQIDRGAYKLLGHKAPKFQDYITANGEPTFAKKDAKGNYIPDKFYHSGFIGTTTPKYMIDGGADYAWIPDLENSAYDAFFLSPSKKFAENFMSTSDDLMSQVMLSTGKEPLSEYSQKPPPPIELATNVSKVWDYRNPRHVDLITDNKSIRKDIMSGHWQTIERSIDKIKELGFDSFVVREDGVDNLGVFNAENVKLLKDEKVVDVTFKFNRVGEVAGSFDPNNPDIRYMPAAYHGTPHTFAAEPGAPFGRFRTSAIGTGEGAQAYGHGLYFAGKKEVAEHYRKVLTQDERGFYDGQPYNSRDPRHQAALDLENFGDREALIGYYERRAKRMPNADRSDLVKILRDKTEAKKTPPPKGSLYKVELAPKENEYLLWDKPLSEQPKGVREKLAKARKIEKRVLGAGVNKKEVILNVDDKFTKGGDAYKELATALTREKGQQDIRKTGGSAMGEQDALASQFLKEAGIPGIKYLDGSSRSKGEGDYNYVIFDEADVQITEKLFMPASEAGAGKGKQAEAAKLWREKGTDSPYFKKYSEGAKIVKIGEQHDFVSGEPVVVEGVHGSTHTFKEFDPSKANPESDLGKAIYISNTPDEVAVNYAGEGPDLTGRIERKAETYMGMVEDELSSYGLSEDATQQQIEAKSYELARNDLVGEGPQTYRVFAKFKNPVVVGEKFKSIDDFRNRGGKKETNFEMMFDEDAGTESGTLVDLLEQVDEVAYNFEFLDVDKLKSDIMEAADYESIGAQRLIETMKESEGLMDVMDANGEFANGEFVRQVFEGMGFDGIIDLSVNEKFGSQRKMGQSMEGMNPDTIHYLAFKPEQIKSATGNRGTFDAGERNINYMPSDRKAPTRQPANRITRQAPAMPGNRFMAPAASAGAKSVERFR